MPARLAIWRAFLVLIVLMICAFLFVGFSHMVATMGGANGKFFYHAATPRFLCGVFSARACPPREARQFTLIFSHLAKVRAVAETIPHSTAELPFPGPATDTS